MSIYVCIYAVGNSQGSYSRTKLLGLIDEIQRSNHNSHTDLHGNPKRKNHGAREDPL